jgi:hypothetical protein
MSHNIRVIILPGAELEIDVGLEIMNWCCGTSSSSTTVGSHNALDRIDANAASFLWRRVGGHPLVCESLDHIGPQNVFAELFLLNKIQSL